MCQLYASETTPLQETIAIPWNLDQNLRFLKCTFDLKLCVAVPLSPRTVGDPLALSSCADLTPQKCGAIAKFWDFRSKIQNFKKRKFKFPQRNGKR
jgi:hypothetical protein